MVSKGIEISAFWKVFCRWWRILDLNVSLTKRTMWDVWNERVEISGFMLTHARMKSFHCVRWKFGLSLNFRWKKSKSITRPIFFSFHSLKKKEPCITQSSICITPKRSADIYLYVSPARCTYVIKILSHPKHTREYSLKEAKNNGEKIKWKRAQSSSLWWAFKPQR